MIQSYFNEVVHSRVPLLGMDTPCRAPLIASLIVISTAFTACEARGDRGSTSGIVAPILLFHGTGTSPNDVAAVETILNSNHLNYSTVNSSQLNEMGESQPGRYRLLIFRVEISLKSEKT